MRLFISFMMFAFSGSILCASTVPEVDLLEIGIASTDSVSPLAERIAQQYLCNIDLMQNAETHIEHNQIETTVKLRFAGAEQMAFYFSQFVLPQGSSLIFRSEHSSDEVQYPATRSGDLATDMLSGSQFELRVLQPEGTAPIQLVLSSFGVSSISANQILASNSLKANSASCNVDIACAEGAAWRQVAGSVCRLIINNSTNCTGTLVNNTADDGKLYVLTANHCISTAAAAQNTRIVFNFEKDACGGTPLKGVSVSGAWLRATSADKSVDFALLELFEPLHPSASVYYAGWDASDDDLAEPVVAVHHPSGDVKKISKSLDVPRAAWFQDRRLSYTLVKNSHWLVKEWDYGVTEGGSSGSVIFNADQKIVGTLTGGDARCGEPYNDFFQKFSYSWDYFPDSSQQLKYWLDPLRTGATQLNGIGRSDYCAGGTDDLFILSNMQSTGYLFGSLQDDTAEFGRYFNKSRNYLSAIGVYVGHNTLSATDIVYVNIYSSNSGQLDLIQQFPLKGSDLHAYSENRIALPQSVILPNFFMVSLYIPQSDTREFALYTNSVNGSDPMSMIKQYGKWLSATDLALGCELPMCIYTTNEAFDTNLKMAYIDENSYTGVRPEFIYPYDSVLLYPNPNRDGIVQILMQGVLDKQVHIAVYANNGVLMGSMSRDLTLAGNAMTCDFSYLAAGLYTLHFELASGTLYRKLLIQK